MIPFHSVLPEIAQREVRCIHLLPEPGVVPTSGLSAGEYAFVEFYCEDLGCDCRRPFIEMFDRHRQDQALASINCGWEPEAFYRERMPWDADAPREIVQGSLDPLNPQSEHAEELLALFQRHVWSEQYRERLRRHHRLFREELQRRGSTTHRKESESGSPSASKDTPPRIPSDRQARFAEVAALLEQFGQQHLDAELTGFTVELWRRLCRRKAPDCLAGKPTVWAAAVTHLIARMNVLFDRKQPVHLTFDTICGFFQVNKTTVGSKATGVERTLRLRQHNEPGLCRREFLETLTFVRASNGMVMSWKMARDMGYLPADARPEDLL
ncbi:MAG: hypothetical protein FJ387_19570 [Verrucomicrobia bacterium]|nr:hypothetical protein [Verrucomicrobiota bacterium]